MSYNKFDLRNEVVRSLMGHIEALLIDPTQADKEHKYEEIRHFYEAVAKYRTLHPYFDIKNTDLARDWKKAEAQMDLLHICYGPSPTVPAPKIISNNA